MLESKKKANQKWNAANLERITIAVRKGLREEIKGWAAQEGMSMAGYIQQACEEKRKRFLQKILDNTL